MREEKIIKENYNAESLVLGFTAGSEYYHPDNRQIFLSYFNLSGDVLLLLDLLTLFVITT